MDPTVIRYLLRKLVHPERKGCLLSAANGIRDDESIFVEIQLPMGIGNMLLSVASVGNAG